MPSFLNSGATEVIPMRFLLSALLAAELLEKRGVIEIWPEKNQYRLKRT